MVDIIITGHGRFASGVASGIELIFGPQDMLDTVEFLDGETKTELDAKMDAALARHAGADGILVLCDVLQGSPFQSAAERAQRSEGVRVVYGANMAMALECVARAMNGDVALDELADAVVAAAREQVGVFRVPAVSEQDDWD